MISRNLSNEIDKRINEIEKTCDNCQDYIICEMNNTLAEVESECKNWKIDFELFNAITADLFKSSPKNKEKPQP